MRPPRVLLFEDEAPLIRLLAWLFEDEGFEVASVASAEEAMQRYGEHLPGVVILNIAASPEAKRSLIDGWRRVAPRTRFVDIRARDPTGRPSAQSGADASFEMPFDSDDLINAARSMQL